MGWKHKERTELVRILRQAAKECGVSVVADNASQAKVRAMAEAVLATSSAQHVYTRKQAREALKRYNETFTTNTPLQEEEAATTSDKEAATTSNKEAATEREQGQAADS